MKRFAILFALLAVVLGSASCEKDEPEDYSDNTFKKIELTTRSADLAKTGNSFAINFIDRVNKAEKGDWFVSPLSMQFLLGMLLNGANGQTAAEICNVLGYGEDEVAAVNEFCLSMIRQLPDLDKQTKLAIANAIFVNKNYSLLDKYKSVVSEYYDAKVTNSDFSNSPAATKEINKWCSDHTNGLITKILDNVNPQMLAYLLNAVYFKSQWKDKFKKENTVKESFTNEAGVSGTVQMMRMNKRFTYQDNEVFQAVRLPYGNGVYSMYVILPAEGKTISDVTGFISGEYWNDFVKSMVMCDVDLWLPKFETKFDINLNEILSGMGMPSSFMADKADFTAMSKSALCLSFVKQKAAIKVDEDGTEAAAVSFAGMETAAAPGQHVVFHADHPFLYMIMETTSGAILFAGKYGGKAN
ncbi:MAG: serpin family protein [Bacteroidales bacterium]|nr:serpin family protein [Bacteroidales bacterium]